MYKVPQDRLGALAGGLIGGVLWVSIRPPPLGVAFYTTLLALLQSAVLTFAMHLIQGREEAALNRVGEYRFSNLVNRLYERSR